MSREDDFKQRIIASNPAIYNDIFEKEDDSKQFRNPASLQELNELMMQWESEDTLNAMGFSEEKPEVRLDENANVPVNLDPGLDLPVGFEGIPGIDWSLFE